MGLDTDRVETVSVDGRRGVRVLYFEATVSPISRKKHWNYIPPSM